VRSTSARRLRIWVHDPEAPSYRYRLEAAFSALERRGFSCETERFPRRRYGLRVLERRKDLKALDLLVVAKLKLLPGETALVRGSARRIVYDFDDAVYFGKPAWPGEPPDRSAFRIRKFAATCRMADLVVAASAELAAFARPWARRVEVVPTGVDISRYPPARNPRPNRPALVWIGLPGNLSYLELVRPAIGVLAREFPGLALRIICSRFPDWPEVPIEQVEWTEESAPAALASASIGIMPLPDDEWARGKGGFKLLQYMAARLPCVASPVGSNREIVVAGETGYFPADDRGWLEALRILLGSEYRRRAMGEAGRARVERLFSMESIAERTAGLYEKLVI
jgi:glycosyltransferase involved in cell wall biosynthesis